MFAWKSVAKLALLVVVLVGLPIGARLLTRHYYAVRREQARAKGRQDRRTYFAARHEAQKKRLGLAVGRRFPPMPLRPGSALPALLGQGHPVVVLLARTLDYQPNLDEWAEFVAGLKNAELLVITEDSPSRVQAAVDRIGSPRLQGATVPRDYLTDRLDLGGMRVICVLDSQGVARFIQSVHSQAGEEQMKKVATFLNQERTS